MSEVEVKLVEDRCDNDIKMLLSFHQLVSVVCVVEYLTVGDLLDGT